MSCRLAGIRRRWGSCSDRGGSGSGRPMSGCRRAAAAAPLACAVKRWPCWPACPRPTTRSWSRAARYGPRPRCWTPWPRHCGCRPRSGATWRYWRTGRTAPVPRPRDEGAAEELDPAVADLVQRLDPFPALVKGRRWDVLAANQAARELFTDWTALPRGQRNLVRWMFLSSWAREVYLEWEPEARAMLGRFRLAAARYPADPGFQELISGLRGTVRRSGTGGPGTTWPRWVAGRRSCAIRASGRWSTPTWCSRWPTSPSRRWSATRRPIPASELVLRSVITT